MIHNNFLPGKKSLGKSPIPLRACAYYPSAVVFKVRQRIMISITELAEHIVLDDVTDIFYRSLCFSNFARSIHDPKNEFEQKLDESISNKLSRQLNWSSSVCSLENATHKMTHLIALLLQGKLNEQELSKLTEDNYWLAAAIEKEAPNKEFINLSSLPNNEIKVSQEFAAMVFSYFKLQLNKPYQYVAEQAELYSQVINEFACKEAPNNELEVEVQHLSFLNAYPFIVLLMLLDKTVQSAKQELLNQIGFECEQSRELVNNYQPSAETVFSFLIFDEFVKYHIHDSLYCDVKTNLGVKAEQCAEDSQQLFLQARTQVILDSLSHIPVLTPEQRAKFSKQLGIQAEFKQDVSDAFANLLKRLMPEKFEYNISLPV